ncbi:MAG: hypothetical protein RBG13Loki_3427 [Promethearchaeota archaeon CR_4]|nr:MAG: hypothetical protein RBG13Loki_3427 [Candidatus Lokiarchaeota archaeon CR_4]
MDLADLMRLLPQPEREKLQFVIESIAEIGDLYSKQVVIYNYSKDKIELTSSQATDINAVSATR